MDKPTPRERIMHILEAIRLIKSFVAEHDEISFLNDLKAQSAVQYQFLIIGEAVKHIDEHILAKYEYPWHIPRSFRNFIIHVYHGVKMERIFYASQDLEPLESVMEKILSDEF